MHTHALLVYLLSITKLNPNIISGARGVVDAFNWRLYHWKLSNLVDPASIGEKLLPVIITLTSSISLTLS